MGLIAYGVIALAILGILGGAVYKVKQWGGDEVRAELQPKLDTANSAIKAQNQAVEALKADGDRKIAAATQGVAKAKAGTAKARSEAERLRVLASQPGKPGACPAGEGVAEVRRGL